MKDLRDWLNEADPVASEPPLSDADVQRMRRAIVAEGESRQSSFVEWTRGWWAAATVVIAVTIAVSMSRWTHPGENVLRDTAAAAPGTAVTDATTRRQVQLIAPGGTRVIWVFNSDFTP